MLLWFLGWFALFKSFSFSSQNICPKGQKNKFTFICITLSNARASSNAGCLAEPFILRAGWSPALSCVFLFLFVWSLPGSPAAGILILVCLGRPPITNSQRLSELLAGKPGFWCKVIANLMSVLFYIGSNMGNFIEPGARSVRYLYTSNGRGCAKTL